jgi:hypothetical protein
MDIYRKVAEFCEPFFKDRDAVFTAASLTTAFIDREMGTEWPTAPDDMKQAVFIGVQQIVRPLLRRYHDEETDETQINLDLPEEDLLQDRYSVPSGRNKHGETIFKYVPRHRLCEADVKAICDRKRKLSRLMARQADALESWFFRQRDLSA